MVVAYLSGSADQLGHRQGSHRAGQGGQLVPGVESLRGPRRRHTAKMSIKHRFVETLLEPPSLADLVLPAPKDLRLRPQPQPPSPRPPSRPRSPRSLSIRRSV